MDTLWQMLFTEGRERVALVGLGGMGKTQIALELAYRVKDSLKPYSVLWMPAHNMAAYEKTATELVQKLAIPCGSDDDPKEVLQSYLSSQAAGNWLLILDNADDMNVLDGLPGGSTGLLGVLPHSPTGRTLITTRPSNIAVHAAGSDVVELTEMTSDEAHDFLGRSLIDRSQLDQVDTAELLGKLSYLPLTVAQAAAYMNMHRLPITAYLRLCNRTNQDMTNLLSAHLEDETHYSKTQGAVATTWIMSFNAICETDAVAARLLSFLQWIEPKAIPETILPSSDSDWSLTEAIGLLCGYSFLGWREDGETLDMHSLVHLALRCWPGESLTSFMTKEDAIEHLTQVFPSDDWEKRLLWRQYFPHVLPLVKDTNLEQSMSSLHLGDSVGRCLNKDGRIREAVEVLQSVVAIRERTLAEDNPSRLASQDALAGVYQANGQVNQAVELLEHVVAIQEKILAKDNPDRLASQHALAIAYQANSQVKQAIEVLQHVVAIEEILAEDNPDRLASQHALGIAYQANGQIKQAIEVLKHVVAIRDREREREI